MSKTCLYEFRMHVLLAFPFGSYVFSKRFPNSVVVTIDGREVLYEVLNVLEFTSARRRMSVVVRDPEGRITLYVKGADNVIYERLSQQRPQLYAESTLIHLKEFAALGLRFVVLEGVSRHLLLFETRYEVKLIIYFDHSAISAYIICTSYQTKPKL